MQERKKRHRSPDPNEAKSIGDLMAKMSSPPDVRPQAQHHAKDQLFDYTGKPRKPRCRFDMFVRYHQRERRDKPQFTYRGDVFETEAERMLWGLVRMFVNNHMRYFLVELYDNTKPANDPSRVILKFHAGVIIENRLRDYAALLERFPVPDWLKV